jgi:hypothetical protein
MSTADMIVAAAWVLFWAFLAFAWLKYGWRSQR